MKKTNIFIIILCILILFLADILNFSHATDTNNLKALQEQYKHSYNKFVKALKNGADQEYINKLTQKCKNDYAAYQKALKSSKDFKNKATTSTTNDTSTYYSQSFNQQPVADSDNQKTVNLKPSRIKESIENPKKIGAIAALKIDSFQPTPLPPDDELLKVDGTNDKIEYINRIKQMHSILVSDDTCYLKNEMDYILVCGNQYPDLCSLAILFYVEGEIKKIVNNKLNGFSDTALLEYELNLRKILLEAVEIYSQDKNMKYDICQNACNMARERLALLDQYINTQHNKVTLNIKNILPLITQAEKDLNFFETNIYNSINRPTGQHIIERCSTIIKSYKMLIDANLVLENYNDAKTYSDKLDEFYQKTIKKQYIIKYSNNTGTYAETINITKTPDEYVSARNNYFTTLLKNEIDSVDYDALIAELKLFKDYAEAIPHASEYDVPIPWIKTTASDLYNSISRPYTISKLTFAKYGEYYPTNFSDVLDSDATVELRFRSSRKLLKNEKFSIEVKSLTSLRAMKVSNFKQSNIIQNNSPFEYYALFRPNIGSKEKDLIRYDEEFKDGIACFNGEHYNSELMTMYNENEYFINNGKHNIFGYSNLYYPTHNFEKIIFPNSKNSLKAGGTEYIQTSPVQNKTTIALTKHQANWFFIDAHGWNSNESGGIVESASTNAVKIVPQELINCNDYQNNQTV